MVGSIVKKNGASPEEPEVKTDKKSGKVNVESTDDIDEDDGKEDDEAERPPLPFNLPGHVEL
jgi:hypothetical protein